MSVLDAWRTAALLAAARRDDRSLAALIGATRNADAGGGEDDIDDLATFGTAGLLFAMVRSVHVELPLGSAIAALDAMAEEKQAFIEAGGPGDFARTVLATAIGRGLLRFDGGTVAITQLGGLWIDRFERAAQRRGSPDRSSDCSRPSAPTATRARRRSAAPAWSGLPTSYGSRSSRSPALSYASTPTSIAAG